jgi:hypothetical protein
MKVQKFNASNKEVYSVLNKNDDNINEFVIIKKKNKITLRYSDDEIWNPEIRNKKILQLIDTGEYTFIKWYENINFNSLDWSQENYLRILLNFNNKYNTPKQAKYKIVKR